MRQVVHGVEVLVEGCHGLAGDVAHLARAQHQRVQLLVLLVGVQRPDVLRQVELALELFITKSAGELGANVRAQVHLQVPVDCRLERTLGTMKELRGALGCFAHKFLGYSFLPQWFRLQNLLLRTAALNNAVVDKIPP